MHRSLGGAFSNYNWAFVNARVNGSPISNLQQISDGNGQTQYLGTHTMVSGDNIIQFGVDNRQASGGYDLNNPGIFTSWCEPFTLVGQTASPVTQCTAMTIGVGGGALGNEDVAVTPGSDVNVQMTVLNPTDTSNMVRINNRDNKCNSTRSNRAALDPLTNPGGTYSEMSRGETDPANFQDCEPPATLSVPTTRFKSISSVVNGNSTTYTFKIKAEQLLKKDLNTGLPIKGIEIADNDQVVDMAIIPAKNTDSYSILSVSSNGYGKRTPIAEYRRQGRGGSGIINIKANERIGALVGVKRVRAVDDVLIISNVGQIIRTSVSDISEIGRNTQGVRVIRLSEGEMVNAIAVVQEVEELKSNETVH
jgi:hypothetical protein